MSLRHILIILFIEHLKKSRSSLSSIVFHSASYFILLTDSRIDWAEILEIENLLSMLCYILHPTYHMKGVNSCIDNDTPKTTIESIAKNGKSWIVILPVIKIASQYFHRMGLLKKRQTKSAKIHRLKMNQKGFSLFQDSRFLRIFCYFI